MVPGSHLEGAKVGDTVSLEVVWIDPDNGDVELRKGKPEMDAEEELRPMLAEAINPPAPGGGEMTYG